MRRVCAKRINFPPHASLVGAHRVWNAVSGRAMMQWEGTPTDRRSWEERRERTRGPAFAFRMSHLGNTGQDGVYGGETLDQEPMAAGEAAEYLGEGSRTFATASSGILVDGAIQSNLRYGGEHDGLPVRLWEAIPAAPRGRTPEPRDDSWPALRRTCVNLEVAVRLRARARLAAPEAHHVCQEQPGSARRPAPSSKRSRRQTGRGGGGCTIGAIVALWQAG